MKKPLIIAVVGIILGNLIAIFFALSEDSFKNQIRSGLSENTKISKIVDEGERQKKIESEESKNWRYYQRFHFHSTGMGAISVGCLLLLMMIQTTSFIKVISAYMISAGGFLYPFVWFFAGLYGPSMGRSEAKEAFAIFGYMGGVYLLGLVLLVFLLCKYPLKTEVKAQS